MNKRGNIGEKVNRESVFRGNSNKVMAPAILANEGKKMSTDKKSSTKQNMKKMDPSENCVELEQRVPIDFVALKAKLAAEDLFVSGLLTNVPTPVAVEDDGSGTSEEAAEAPLNGGSENRASDPEELKERLAAKLSQFKGRKLDFSDKKMKTKLKRKLDKLEKKKLKKKNNKMKSKIAKLAQATKAASIASSTSSSTSPSNAATVKVETPEPVVQSRPPKPIFNSEGRMVFSKFDFGELTAPTTTTKTNLDPKAALHKIKKVKEKVKHLEAKGAGDVAKSIMEKKAWEGALKRAEGVKVKDNVELLAKSIKKREKQKLQSKKKWDERIEAQEQQKEERQKKRKANINKKKSEKKEKKISRLAKRGKFVNIV